MRTDLISKQMAIDEIARWKGYLDEDMIKRIQIGLKKFPPAQPDVIRCKDCKFYTKIRMDLKTCIGICILTCRHLGDDGFCSEAERRTE